MKRPPMPRRAAWLRSSAPKPATVGSSTRKVTAKLRASRRQLGAIKPLVFDRDRHLCAWCNADAEVLNHRTPRGMGGSSNNLDIHSPANLISMCNRCHHLIETKERARATDQGFFVPRGLSPEHCPVLYWAGGWHKLYADGTRVPITIGVDL